MKVDDFLLLAQFGIQTAVYICAPILGFGLVAGLAVSIFQAASQISDAALAFLPKIAAAIVGILIFGPFMVNRLASFTTWVYSQIPVLTQ